MQERIKNIADSLLNRWKALEKGQKIRLCVAVVMLAVIIGITIFFATRPQMTLLTGNLERIEAAQIKQALEEAGIKAEISPSLNQVLVNEKDATNAYAILANQNLAIPGTPDFDYEDLIAGSSVGSSDRITKEGLKKTKESQIVQGLKKIEGIEDAQVDLVLADDTVYFWEANKESSASVRLTTHQDFSREQKENIAKYVSSAVTGLALKNIEIFDQNSNTIYSGMTESDESNYGRKNELEEAKKAELTSSIRAILSPMYSEIQTVYNLVFDFNTQTEEAIEYYTPIADSNTGIVESERKSSSTVSNGEEGAQPGLGTNDNVAPTYEQGSPTTSNASTKDSDVQYKVSQKTTISEKGSLGNLMTDKSSISIVAYKYKTLEETYAKKNNILGDLTWEEYKDQNSAEIELPENPKMLEALVNGTNITNLRLLSYEKTIFIDAVAKPVNIEQVILLVILATLILLFAYGLIKNSEPDEITEIEPELSVEDLLVSTKLEESEDLSETERMKSLEVKESETKRQIEKFVNEKPEAVAQLLRNWLNDEWE